MGFTRLTKAAVGTVLFAVVLVGWTDRAALTSAEITVYKSPT